MNKILILVTVLLVMISPTHQATAEIPREGILAPDFSITRTDGTKFTLSDYKGKKAVYLTFWTTWCTYCMKKIPKLQHATYVLSKQIEIIAIDTSVKDTLKKVMAFKDKYDIKYPLAFDHGKKVTDLYGVWGTPTEFIIDINGYIVHSDNVPEDLESHISSWNMIDRSLINSKTALDDTATRKDCNREAATC